MSPARREPASGETRTVGRYVLYAPIARGGMATVHLARLVGGDGFSRVVAAKRLHEQFADDPDFIEMFRNEARIASRVHHPNVVPVLDLVVERGEVLLVQEYVRGVPLDRLLRAAAELEEPIWPDVAVAIAAGILSGVHAAHEAKDERGEPLGVIHRDVSPHNVVVGEDGVPRLLDFGIAKARSSANVTREGFVKGKISYMAPEQFRSGKPLTRRVDIYAAGVVIWEMLAMRRLHKGRDDLEVLGATIAGDVPNLMVALADEYAAMGEQRWGDIERLAPVVAKMMSTDPERRYETAEDALFDLVAAVPPAPAAIVGEWVRATGHEWLERVQELLRANEESWRTSGKLRARAPESGVRIATRPSLTDEARPRVTPPPLPRTTPSPPRPTLPTIPDAEVRARASSVPSKAPPKRTTLAPRRGGRAGWFVAGVLLAALVGLIATLVARPDVVFRAVEALYALF